MEGRLNYMLEKSVDLEKDEENEEEKEEEKDKEEAEKEREDEDSNYEYKRKALKKEREDGDQALILFHELQKEEIANISKDNQAKKEIEDTRQYHFKLPEERRREDERKFMFKQLQANREIKEQERIRELSRDKEERIRDRIRDRQKEADRNLPACFDLNANLTFKEGQLDVMDARGRLLDEKMKYIEELKSERESIRQGDRDIIDYLSRWQREDPTERKYGNNWIPLPEKDTNKSLKDS